MSAGLARYAGFAAVLAAAGLPIYIHAPKFYVDTHGVTLAELSVVLFGLRLVDLVQDPLLGRLAEVTAHVRGPVVTAAGVVMAAAMLMLFAVPPALPPLWWFALSLAALFSAFSFLTICFYAQGVAKAGSSGGGHVRLSGWRETGSLIGVCIAAALPSALAVTGAAFTAYAIAFAAATGLALVAMWPEWTPRAAPLRGNGLRTVLSDAAARRLLLVALVNATPVAVTSTLFLFYVADRLGAPGWEGPLLLLFFLSAAIAVPVWAGIARRSGARRTLLVAMILAIASFALALPLGTGDVLPFAGVCIACGAAVGADLSLLPALFARRLAAITPAAADGFGLWSFVNKATLAVAALVLFPILSASGFVPGEQNGPAALWSLTLLYAGLPLALKTIALVLMARTGPETDA